MTRTRVKGVLFASAMLLSFFVVSAVSAADPKLTIQHESVAAKYVGQSIPDPIEIETGESKTVIMKFKNVGTESWNSLSQHPNGYRHVSAYTMEPRERNSAFRGSNWISRKQTASIAKDTKPGAVAELPIVLTAPDKVGTYKEEFHLAAENYTWIKGGYFYLDVKVVEKKVAAQPVTPDSSSPEETDSQEGTVDHKVNKFIQSKKAVKAVGGERVQVILGFQNVGESTWKEFSLTANSPTALASVTQLSFADDVWYDKSVAIKKTKDVAPGAFIRENIFFRTPAKQGDYTLRFELAIDGQRMEDVLVEIPVTVTADAPSHYRAPKSEAPSSNLPATYRFDSEPRIRVGLYRPETFVQFRSAEAAYDVYTGTTKVGTLPQNKLGVLKFVDGQYTFKGGDIDIKSDEYIRLSPVGNPHAIFTLWNYQRHVKWKGPENFNVYRGAVEYRRGEVKDDLWVLNDLLLEDYVKGIAENSNGSPAEYLKSQTVAQRSYAYATIQSDKYGIFDVVATTGDQLYLGVEAERITPNFVAAAKATRGQMVAYDGKIVITPYFARTHCRTLGWHEKWGGPVRPWLVSVKTNYDCARGKSLFGHGVGMSQIDASIRAKEEGLGWRDLVKYYYTGVEIERVYQ